MATAYINVTEKRTKVKVSVLLRADWGSRDLNLRIYIFLLLRFENHDLLSYNLLLGYTHSLKLCKSFFFLCYKVYGVIRINENFLEKLIRRIFFSQWF